MQGKEIGKVLVLGENPQATAKDREGLNPARKDPGQHWEKLYGYHYLLVLVDTFSGWVEAFPTRTESAQIVAKKLLNELVPRFGIPIGLGSDNGPAFIAQISKMLAKSLQINWKLLCLPHPKLRAGRKNE